MNQTPLQDPAINWMAPLPLPGESLIEQIKRLNVMERPRDLNKAVRKDNAVHGRERRLMGGIGRNQIRGYKRVFTKERKA